MTSPHVFDVTAATFQTDVAQRSTTVPILLDFWAEWCSPCKTLTPLLESVADEYGGAFLLGKVNTEKEQELAHAFQVQSIPFGVLLVQGRPADAFTGAIADPQLRAFLARSGIEPVAGPADKPEDDPDSPEAKLSGAKQAITAGDFAAAAEALAGIDDESELAAERERLQQGLVWFDTELDPGGPPAAASLARARTLVRDQQFEQAMEEILESVAQDRGFQDALARKAMLLCLSLVGEDTDLGGAYRRRLATLLY